MPLYAGGRAQDLLYFLDNYGLSDVIIPFLLVFLIVFAALQKTHILGKDRKQFNVSLSLLLGLMVVLPHVFGKYPPNADVVTIMNSAIPNVSIVAVAIVMLLLLLGIFGVGPDWASGGAFSSFIAIAAFGAIIYFFGAAAGWWQNITISWWGSDTTSIIIIILVFGLIIGYITKDETSATKASAFSNVMQDVRKFFGGGGGGHH